MQRLVDEVWGPEFQSTSAPEGAEEPGDCARKYRVLPFQSTSAPEGAEEPL